MTPFSFYVPVYVSFSARWQDMIDILGEMIYGFITTNITLKIILLILNIPVYFLLGRLLFGSWSNFRAVLKKGFIIDTLGPLMFLFYRGREKIERIMLSRKEMWISILVNLLWVSIYISLSTWQLSIYSWFEWQNDRKKGTGTEKRGQARRPETGLRASPHFSQEPVPIFLRKGRAGTSPAPTGCKK